MILFFFGKVFEQILMLLIGPLTPDPSVEDEDSKSKPLSFFVRMKCTLVRRGGSYTKSSGFKVSTKSG